jgi:predicted aspartyl protease
VDGLIGMDVFSHFLVTLDYPASKLLLGPLPPRPGETTQAPALNTDDAKREDSDDAEEPAEAAENSPVQKPSAHGPYNRYIAPEMKDYTHIYRVGHLLILPAGLSSEKVQSEKVRLFVLDTGAFSTTISPQAAREVTKVRSDYFKQASGISGKVENVFSADQVTFRFAHLSQKGNGVFSIDTSRISKNVGMEISGFLGANTLDQLTIHIDYRDGLVKFDYDPKRKSKY